MVSLWPRMLLHRSSGLGSCLVIFLLCAKKHAVLCRASAAVIW